MTKPKSLPVIELCHKCQDMFGPDVMVDAEYRIVVYCPKCKLYGPQRSTVRAAIIAWNKMQEKP